MRYRLVAIALSAFASYLPAQDTRGAITGRVTDPQGAVIVGASITVTDTDTNTSTRLKTNSSGIYAARPLDPGNYTVVGEASGFKTSVRAGLVVQLGLEIQVDFRMELGSATDSVTISAESPILETDSVSTGRAMTTRELMELPVMGNDIVLQATLAAGIAGNGINQYTTEGMVNGSSQPYYAAGNVGGNEWSIDGAPNNGDQRRTNYTPSTDTVEEFKVETSNFDASVGHTTGLSVQMQTKSGTNTYHGTASDMYWNTHFNAAGFYQKQAYYAAIAQANAAGNTTLAHRLANSPILPGGHSNNYTGTLGGPVRIPKVYNGKNRLFFFFSYAGAKDRQPARAAAINYTVPTALERTGNFSDLLPFGPQYQIYDPLSVAPDPSRPGHFVRTPFVGNIIPPSRIPQNNAIYNFVNKYMPMPNTSFNNPTAVNYIASCEVDNTNYTGYDQRTDYQLNANNRISVRWSYTSYLETTGDFTCNGILNDDEQRFSKTAVATWTHIFNSSTVFDLSASGTSFIDRDAYFGEHTLSPAALGLPQYMETYCQARNSCELPVLNISGYPGMGNGGAGYPYDRTINAKSNISHVTGRHTFRAGMDYREQIHSDPGAPGNASGAFNFDQTYDRKDDDGNAPNSSLGLSWASLMMGLPTVITADNNTGQTLSNPYYGWYGQDNWRIRNNLTITLGLRMEYELGPTDRYNRMVTGFNPTAQLPIAAEAEAAYAANPQPQLAPSAFVVIGGNEYAGLNGASRQLWGNQLMYMPRTSVAWHFTPKMVFRAGYGKYYDTLNVNNEGINQAGYSRTTTSTVSNNFGQTWLVGNPAAGISPETDPFPIRADGTRFDQPYGNSLGPSYEVGRGFGFTDPDRRHAFVQKWRAGVQRQVGRNMVAEAAYWGQWGSDINITQPINPLPGSYYNFSEVRNNTPANVLNANVTNPFYIGNFPDIQTSNPNLYQVMSSNSFFSSKTIQLNKLLVQYPQMNGLSMNDAPLGRDKINAVDMLFTKRFSAGFNFNAAYTWLHALDKTTYINSFDPGPSWLPANSSRPRRLTMTGIYEFPFGKGKPWVRGGIFGQVMGGWQISGTYLYQPGDLISWPNLFYNGNLATIGHDLETGCTPMCNQINSWFNTSLPFVTASASQPAAYQARVFPVVIDGVRGDKQSLINGNVLRNFKVRENLKLQLRLDVQNIQNTSQFNDPTTSPTSTQFGKVTGQTLSVNRFYDAQLRLQF